VSSNLALYILYLGLTALGVTPKIAMSLLFLVGVVMSFVWHKQWTFGYEGSSRRALPRYAVAYGGAYLLNFVLLVVLAGELGWPHQIVQAGAMGLNALLLFLLQRHWVFRQNLLGQSAGSRSAPGDHKDHAAIGRDRAKG
jgi:putative flippase GtrA